MAKDTANPSSTQVASQGNLATAFTAGFDRLVPLIPVDGVLFQGGYAADGSWMQPADVDPKHMGKVPGYVRNGCWHPRSGWVGYQITPEDIALHDAAGASCGLLGGDRFVGFDLDATDPELAAAWLSALRRRWPDLQYRVGQWPKMLIVARVAGDPVSASKVEFNAEGREKQQIEIIGTGRQMVLLGTHPITGQPYQWFGPGGLPGVPDQPVAPSAARCPTVSADDVATIVEELATAARSLGWARGRSSRTGEEQGTSELADHPPDIELAADILRAIPNTVDGGTWFRIAYALYWEFGDAGWPLFLEFSQRWQGGKDDEGTIRRQWRKCSRPNGSVTWGTIMNELRRAGVVLPPDLEARRRADLGQRRFERDVAKLPPASGVVPVGAMPLGSVTEARRELIEGEFISDGTKLIWCTSTALALLETHDAWADVLAFDEFLGEVQICQPIPGTDPRRFKPHAMAAEDVAAAEIWFNRQGFPRATENVVAKAMLAAANQNTVDPVRFYLEALTWDGTPRLATWLSVYMGASSDLYVSEVGKRTLIGAVARAVDPGCKVDTMTILEGRQGIRKSQALRVLASPDWFADSVPDLKTKDAADYLQGVWIIEMAELEMVRRAEMETTKAFLSRQDDRYRPAYGRTKVKRPRRCIFIGTTNQDNYLRDETGSRRFWPVEVKTIDLAALKRDRDQLWAEAYAAYKAGEQWWLSGIVETLATAEQRKRNQDDPWTGPVLGYVDERAEVSIREILFCALGFDKPKDISRSDSDRVAGILKANGWKRDGQFTSGSLKGQARYLR
ncbi:PriCT-2 domain-containing protein [Ruegeria sp. WL0004]|uniref:PriCT-2 domain-containing protein n=1 Tax=Ruegeria marisflavi TaxID=2984152 RepID=A0ABT2WTY9_9RHOB|nr:VapE domain-containing protein [Ruegeria sp. WL0004]MCU9839152.1 PriCT-2 domain-containing protein [Ruegeria sp. WL0004]